MHKTTNDRIRHPAKVSHRTQTPRTPKVTNHSVRTATATKQDRHKAPKLHGEIARNKMIVLRKTSVRKTWNARTATAAISPYVANGNAGSAVRVRFSAQDKTPGPMARSGTSLHHRRHSNKARTTAVASGITATAITSGRTSVATANNMEWSARGGTTTGTTARNSHQTAPALRNKTSVAWMRVRKMDALLLLEGQTRKNCGTFLK